MYRRLFGYLRPHRGSMVATVSSRIVAAVLDAFTFALLIPFLKILFAPPSEPLSVSEVIPPTRGPLDEILRATVGVLLSEGWMRSLFNVIAVIMAVVLLKNFFVWWGGQAGAQLQEYVNRDMRNQVFSHVIRLPMTFHSGTKLGQLLSRILADTEQSKQLITQLVAQGIQNMATIVASIALLFMISVKLTLFSLLVAPLIILALQPLLKRLRSGYRRITNERGELTSRLQEVLGAARLVKSYGAEPHEQEQFERASHVYSRGLVKVTRYSLLSQPITEIIGTAAAMCLLLIGARDVFNQGTMDGALLLTFLAVALKLLQPLKQLSQIPAVAQGSLAAAERLFQVLDQPTEPATDRGTREISTVASEIRFENVSFDYGASGNGGANASERGAAVSGVSFTARRGQIVALVGPSGAGKSTLVDLIPRFHDATSGSISIDGVDIRDIRLDSLRKLIGIVSQETVLFNDTVRSNIAYGSDSRYSDEQIIQAARLANAHDFIAQLPEGYASVIGERGARLSGGQRQRLSIARALLADTPILILDEATSALDTESERLVQEAIDRLLQGRTVFVIAHRLSTVMHADQILVLDNGALVERGTHEELLSQNGLYARLHAMQFRDPAPSTAS